MANRKSLLKNGALVDGSIEAGLLLLLSVTPRGQSWTQDEIAAACGCTRAYIWNIEKAAMKKLKRAAARRDIRERLSIDTLEF